MANSTTEDRTVIFAGVVEKLNEVEDELEFLGEYELADHVLTVKLRIRGAYIRSLKRSSEEKG